jgi:hypothetical protein
MLETDPPRPLAFNIDRSSLIQLSGPALKVPFLTKIPIDEPALSTNQGVNWLRRG